MTHRSPPPEMAKAILGMSTPGRPPLLAPLTNPATSSPLSPIVFKYVVHAAVDCWVLVWMYAVSFALRGT